MRSIPRNRFNNPNISAEKTYYSQFETMNQLAEAKKAFFFLISFDMQEVHIFEEESLQDNPSIRFQFPGKAFRNEKSTSIENYSFKAFPETKEHFAKGFQHILQGLKRGNSYLANYTRKTKIETSLSLNQIFDHTQRTIKFIVAYHEFIVLTLPIT